MTIFDSFLLAQLDVFIPVSGLALMILFCFELSISLRLLMRRQPALIPVEIRRDEQPSSARRRNDYDEGRMMGRARVLFPVFPLPDPLRSFIVYPLLLFIILMPRTFSPIVGKCYSVLACLRFQAINNGFSASHAIRRVDA